jgi:MFS family permease
MAMTPSLVEPHELQASNALMQGTTQIIGVVGPGIAGILVSAVGLLVSFAFDAWTFLFTAVMLLIMRVPPTEKRKDSAERRGGVLGEIGEMLGYVRRDAVLSTVLTVALALNFFLTGPMIVGTAVLAKERFAEGSVALGLMLSSLAVGSLLGTVAAGVLRPKRFGLLILALLAVAGASLALLGIAPVLPLACALLGIMGASFGFTNVLMFTWIQKRIAPEMMGRVMSLIGLAAMGLAPISNGLAGVLAAFSLPLMLVGAGIVLVVVCVVAGSRAEMRSIQA